MQPEIVRKPQSVSICKTVHGPAHLDFLVFMNTSYLSDWLQSTFMQEIPQILFMLMHVCTKNGMFLFHDGLSYLI